MASSSTAPAPAQIYKRLHVSGLIPSITTEHLKDRFKSFGEVMTVEELGQDGNGQPRNFAYLTLRTTPAQLTKCLNIMSGSKWRGATLKLGEAKRRYDWRLEAEKNPSEEELAKAAKRQERKNAKKRARFGLGRECDSMKPVTLKQAEKRKFWQIDPGTSEADSEVRIVRPLCFRPLHPITKPEITYIRPTDIRDDQPAAKLTTKEQLKLKIKQARKERRKAPPPTRAQRRVLDPLAYGSRYRVFDNDTASQELVGEWVFVPVDDEAGVVGEWQHVVDGDVVESERVLKAVAPLHQPLGSEGDGSEDDVADELDEVFAAAQTPSRASNLRVSSPLFSSSKARAASPELPELDLSEIEIPSRASSPLFATREGISAPSPSRSPSPMFPIRSGAPAPSSPQPSSPFSPQRDDLPSSSSERSASPLFPIRQAAPAPVPQRATSPLPVSVPKVQAAPFDEALAALARQERLAGLGVLSGLFDDDDDQVEIEVGQPKKGKSEWRGFDESDSENEMSEPLRLRGGAAESSGEESEESSSEEDSSSEESSSEDDSDESSSEESSSEEESSGEGSAAAMEVDTLNKPSNLKDMFAARPQQTSGFSLMQNLDVELDDDVPFAITAHAPVVDAAAPELELLAPSAQAVFDPDPSIPLFFPVGTKLTGSKAEAADPMAEAQEPGYKAFHRQETDAEMTARWDEQKLELTREYKRRHRDAVKQRRRRQGGAEAGETFD